jgi:hypothetical protein
MKIRHVAAIVVIFSMLSASGAWSKDDENTFLGIKWGSAPSDYPFLKKEWEKDDVVFYSSSGRIPILFDRELPKAVYGFFSNRFFSVFFEIDNPEDSGFLRKKLRERFGDPKKSFSAKNNESALSWKKGQIKIKMKLRETEGRVKLAVYYLPISSQVNEEGLEAASENRVRFFPIDPEKKPERIPFMEF